MRFVALQERVKSARNRKEGAAHTCSVCYVADAYVLDGRGGVARVRASRQTQAVQQQIVEQKEVAVLGTLAAHFPQSTLLCQNAP